MTLRLLLSLAGMGVLAAQPAPAQDVQAPGQPHGQQSQAPPQVTLDEVDRAIERLKQSHWQFIESIPPVPPDLAGNTIEQDVDRYLLTDESLDRIAAVRGTLESSVPASGAVIPPAALEPMTRLLVGEACKQFALAAHWRSWETLDRHRTLLQTLAGHLPAASRDDAVASLKRLDERVLTHRGQLAPAMQSCSDTQRPDFPASLDVEALVGEFNTERARLAASLDLEAGDWPSTHMDRDRPCPPPAETTPGPNTQLRRRGNPVDYFPQSAIQFNVVGTVRVRLSYDNTGCVTATSVLVSSGSTELDEAALRFGFDTELIPAAAEAQSGGAVILPVHFSLRDRTDVPPGAPPAQPQP